MEDDALEKVLTKELELKGGKALGLLIEIGAAPLILIRAPKGFVMCGYLNIQTANRLGDAAAMVRGVMSFEEVLSAKVVEVSEKARIMGIIEGITGKEALEKMF